MQLAERQAELVIGVSAARPGPQTNFWNPLHRRPGCSVRAPKCYVARCPIFGPRSPGQCPSDPHSSPSAQLRPRSPPANSVPVSPAPSPLDHRTLLNFPKLPILEALMWLSPAQHARKGIAPPAPGPASATGFTARPGRSTCAPSDISDNFLEVSARLRQQGLGNALINLHSLICRTCFSDQSVSLTQWRRRVHVLSVPCVFLVKAESIFL